MLAVRNEQDASLHHIPNLLASFLRARMHTHECISMQRMRNADCHQLSLEPIVELVEAVPLRVLELYGVTQASKLVRARARGRARERASEEGRRRRVR